MMTDQHHPAQTSSEEEDFLLSSSDSDDDELLFMDDDESEQPDAAVPEDRWRILIVDDEEEVHKVTQLALKNFTFDRKGLEFLDAYSGKEAREVLRREPDLAMVLLDVVMETDEAGLDVVNFIRRELGNKYIRIVLRTGQPGSAPEETVVSEYDIDDYKTKTELTSQKLQTSLISSLRAYRELQYIDSIVQERTRELAEVNTSLMDSIEYARRIQQAILPEIRYMKQYLPESFVFYRPRDVVSGDFYYFDHIADHSIVASIDCTGHGVPGAIMSMLGHNMLEHTLQETDSLIPDAILMTLDEKVRYTLKQGTSANNDVEKAAIRDGMDLSLVVINHRENKLIFAGAQRPLYYIRDGEMHQISGSKNPIGDEGAGAKKIFEVHEIDLQPGDTFYLFSDGITDQFGGPKNRKFSPRRFRELMLENWRKPMEEQHDLLAKAFDEWKSENEQTDDVSVVGIRVLPLLR